MCSAWHQAQKDHSAIWKIWSNICIYCCLCPAQFSWAFSPSLLFVHSWFYKLLCSCVLCPISWKCHHLPKYQWHISPPRCTNILSSLLLPWHCPTLQWWPACIRKWHKRVNKAQGVWLWPALQWCVMWTQSDPKGNLHIHWEQVIFCSTNQNASGVKALWESFISRRRSFPGNQGLSKRSRRR